MPFGVRSPSLNWTALLPLVAGKFIGVAVAVACETLPVTVHPVNPDSKLPLTNGAAESGVGVTVGVGETSGPMLSRTLSTNESTESVIADTSRKVIVVIDLSAVKE